MKLENQILEEPKVELDSRPNVGIVNEEEVKTAVQKKQVSQKRYGRSMLRFKRL